MIGVGGILGLGMGVLFAFLGVFMFGALPSGNLASVLSTVLGPVAAYIAPVLNLVKAAASIVNLPLLADVLIWFALAVLITWLAAELASLAYTGSQSHTDSQLPAATRPALSPPAGERFLLGFLIGFAVGINCVFWLVAGAGPQTLPLPPGVTLSVIIALVSLLPLLCLFIAVSTSRGFQTFIAWFGWLSPYSWLADVIGFVLFIGYAVVYGANGNVRGVRFDAATSAFELSLNGLPSDFSAGHFNLVNSNRVSAFNIPGTSAHESGHTLNTMLLGAPSLAANAIMIPIHQPNPHRRVWGEMLAEGHRPHTIAGLPFCPLWSR